MNDRELLELAAKAAGIKGQYIEKSGMDGYPCDMAGISTSDFWSSFWNPLVNNGNALELAVKLRMDLMLYSDTKSAFIEKPDAKDMHQFAEINLDDPYAATRRAIVRAAAEIGKGMR